MLLSMAERRLGVAERLAALLSGSSRSARIHPHARGHDPRRIFAISCGYEDADDLAFLRADPVFKLACGGCPIRAAIFVRNRRFAAGECAFVEGCDPLSYALVDQWMDAYERAAAHRRDEDHWASATGALIGLMVYSFARIGAAIGMRVDDVYREPTAMGSLAREGRQATRHAVPS